MARAAASSLHPLLHSKLPHFSWRDQPAASPCLEHVLCLRKAKSILQLAQRLPDCASVSQPPLRVISLISSLTLLLAFLIKEHFPCGTEKNVTYRFIAMRGKNNTLTTKTSACEPFAAVFFLLQESQCLCTEPSADLQPGDTVRACNVLSWQWWQECDWNPMVRLGMHWGKEGAPRLCWAPLGLHFPSLAQNPIVKVMERIDQL